MSQMPYSEDLFGQPALSDLQTEGVKYIGSKLKLIPQIIQVLMRLEVKTVFDGFSGTSRVSQALAKCGYAVHSSDISAWSKVFANCYLGAKRGHDYRIIIDALNSATPLDGWFTRHYGGTPGEAFPQGMKYPWQRKNTRKLDGVRARIDKMCLEPHEKDVALTSLMLALDKVDNTLGHFTSYLGAWSQRSYNDLVLREPRYVFPEMSCRHSMADIFSVVDAMTPVDLAYLDPPYGSNNEKMPPSRVRYASYYHLWTTVCLNDEPDVFGKARRRKDTRDTVASSVFEEYRMGENGCSLAVEAIDKLIRQVKARYVLLSYSSGGKATLQELKSVLGATGKLLEIIEIEYRRNVMAGMRWTHEWTRLREGRNLEYLFLLDKGLY